MAGAASCGTPSCDPGPLPARHTTAEHAGEAPASFTDASAVTSRSSQSVSKAYKCEGFLRYL